MNSDQEETPKNYLTPEEVQSLAVGLPAAPGDDLIQFLPDSAVQFTAKGRQFYRLAMLLIGLSPEPVDAVRDCATFARLVDKHRRVMEIVEKHVTEFGRTGRVPSQGREIAAAARSGDMVAMHLAMERRLLAEEAGPNVIPVNFGDPTRKH